MIDSTLIYRSEEQDFSEMKAELLNVRVEDRYTESEKTMTESDLLGLMEKYGIGTDASMATHIKNIIGKSF
jgi:DNA topoisomerase-3